MILTHIYDVDISQPLLPTILHPMMVTGDKLANRIGVRLKNGAQPYTPDGSCRGYVLRADGATVPILDGVVNGNEMYIDLPEAAYAVQGSVVISIVCVTSTAITTVFLGSGTVNRSQTDVVIDPGTVIDDISTLIQEIETAVASIPEDYSTLSSMVDALTHFDLSISGKYIASTGAETANSDYSCTDYIPVDSDSVLILDGFWTGTGAYAYMFYDSAKAKISGANSITSRTVVDTIPSGAAYVRFSSRTSQGETPVAYVSNHVVEDVAALRLVIDSELRPNDMAIRAAAAPNYGTWIFPVAVGDYVWYNGVLRKAKQDIATAEDWTAAHWDTAVIGEDVADLKSAVDKTYIRKQRGYVRISTGYRLAESSGYCAQNADYNLIKFPVTAGDLIYVICDDRMQFQTDQSSPTTGARNRVGDTYGAGTYHLIVPDTATWLIVSTPATGSTAQFFVDIPAGDSIKALQGTVTRAARMAYLNWTKGDRNTNGDIYTASMSASSRIPLQNILSAYAARRTRIHAWDKTGAYLGRIAADDTLTKASGTVTRHYLYDLPISQIKTLFPAIYAVSFIVVPEGDETVSDYRAFAQSNLSIRISHDSDDVGKWLDNAYYVPNNTTTPALKLLHISDIHANIAALDRINQKVSGLLQKIDGKICTGDMTYNVAGEIASWWDASYMTAIGNHDTREGNNWTALSVADRIAYYISPFEENWGITRPSGCSYYYKDYATQKVRLIVLDGMLYVSGGEDAAAQNTWLGDTIDAAITADYHVLIAIHAPHGGAVSVPCTFSDVTATTYSGNANICDTPQSVIDLVATKIAAGCHFIGYLVGHTHRDGIWKVTEDGTQMMYCVTCGTDTLNSDQMREVVYAGTNRNSAREFQYAEGAYYDAANLVVIDTAHSLIKLIRVGGADRDIYMRPRKAICIRYSDGTLMGEDK